MKTPARLLLFLLLVFSGLRLDAQKARMPLDETIFKTSIRDSGWVLVDTAKTKSAAEFFVLSFARDTLAVAYINFLTGGTGGYSRYDCAYRNNFMEVKALNWHQLEGVVDDDSAKISGVRPMQYLYVYRKSKTELGVLFMHNKKKMNDALLQETGWLTFTLMPE